MLVTRAAGVALATACLTLGLLGPAAPPAHAAGATTSPAERQRVDTLPTPTLAWTPCELGECASVRLPLDYDEPGGQQVVVALTRIPARKPAERIGSLFLNPGGPGARGTTFPLRATAWLGSDVQDRFDLIGFDPRGTYDSTNTACFPTVRRQQKVTGEVRDILFPFTHDEEDAFIRAARTLARACSGPGRVMASSVSTAEVARDLEMLRRAVGDEKLSYLGFSYGTYLGQVYANMFPDRFRAMAIDGVLDPREWVGTDETAGTPASVRTDGAGATQFAYTEVVKRCRAAGDACPLADPDGTFRAVAARLQAAPLPLPDADGTVHNLTYQQFVASIVYSLYSPEGAEMVPYLIAMIDQLQTAPLTQVQRTEAATGYRKSVERSTQRPQAAYDNGIESVPAIMCSDSRNPRSAQAWRDLAASEDARAPHFGRQWLWASVYCASRSWRAMDEDAWPGPFDTRTDAPVLVVGNWYDPATRYGAAVAVAKLLPNSRLLSSTNWGHTAYGVSACATAHVDRYLIDGTLPPAGTLCDDTRAPFQP